MHAKSLFFTIIAACSLSSASAIPLATYNFSIGPDGTSSDDPHVIIWAGYGFTNNVFGSTWVSKADAGKTFSATAASDPGFRDVVALLTNGADDVFWFWRGPGIGGAGTGNLESRFFTFTQGGAPDLAGYAIDSMELHLDTFTVGPAYGGTGYSISGTLSILGQPVPDTSVGTLCLASVFIGFAAVRRRLT